MNKEERQRPWWGEYELELDEAVKWEIGPLHLWLRRSRSEWWLAHDWLEEDRAPDADLERDLDVEEVA